MRAELRRLFISDLPEGLAENDLTNKFGHFGDVTSVEIKERKDVSSKHATNHFAFINVEIDNASLQQCLQEFSHKKWNGHYVNVQLAKESFLDRLKREREEANRPKDASKPSPVNENKVIDVKINGVINKGKVKKFDETNLELDENEEDDEENDVQVKKKQAKKKKVVEVDSSEESEEEDDNVINIEEDFTELYSDVVVKDNRDKKLTNKIDSVGNEPINKIEIKKPKSKDPKRTEADTKRINSMMEMKKGYQQQKSAIKAALSRIDVQSKNKITFNDDGTETCTSKKRKMVNGVARHESNLNKRNKKALFDNDDEGGDETNYNFEVKKQFEGRKGQKLLELQSKYKNDVRFQMDERFVEEDQDENGAEDTEMNDDEITAEEKRKQMEILEEVLGKKINKFVPPMESNKSRKAMLRFDPDQPEHSKYEVRGENKNEKKKKKRKNSENEENNELPEVSKETFYEVKDAFKTATQEKEGFSLLSMFGRKDDDVNRDEEIEESEVQTTEIQKKKKKKMDTQNPFRYDSSSDDEGGTKHVKAIKEKAVVPDKSTEQRVNLGPTKLWSEPFFFKDDDYRFQEGLDFIKRLEGEGNPEFVKLRRSLKEIVRAKVRNNLNKNKQFKKKLGGSKRKKMLRVKKAIKR